MSQEYKVYLADMLEAVKKIKQYTKGLDKGSFEENDLVVDASIRNLLIIGEAAKRVPEAVKKSHPEIEWKKVAGLRDILVHEYSGVDMSILWDVIANKLDNLHIELEKMLK